jgi:GT2 family glycosyltransferase
MRLHAPRGERTQTMVVDPPATDATPEDFAEPLRSLVNEHVPAGARVLVVSKYDHEALHLRNHESVPFPHTSDGEPTGYSPESSLGAIAHLEAARARGAEYLAFPETALWWLDYYSDFATYIKERYRAVVHQHGRCAIYSLQHRPLSIEESPTRRFEEIVIDFQNQFDRDPAILDWDTRLQLSAVLSRYSVFSPPTNDDVLPYLDHTIDIVAIGAHRSVRLEEARRAAHAALISVTAPPASTDGSEPEPAIDVDWLVPRHHLATTAVSVIVSTAGVESFSKVCLEAVKETSPKNLALEILVIDDDRRDGDSRVHSDGSSADTRMRFIATAPGLDFTQQCNEAAKQAAGDVLVFLSADTIPLQDWLSPLIRTFRTYPNAGVVGAKLLGEDGSLLEVGGNETAQGQPERIGRGNFDIDSPEYRVLRPVDFSSSALLATRRSLFLRLGGFDVGRPSDEGAEYCARVRRAGYTVYARPDTVAIHYGSRYADASNVPSETVSP